MKTCLGDLYSVNWLEDSEEKAGQAERLGDQFLKVLLLSLLLLGLVYYYVSVIVQVSCIMYHVSCIMYHVSCIRYQASSIRYQVLGIKY